jgi:hypothetical protein
MIRLCTAPIFLLAFCQFAIAQPKYEIVLTTWGHDPNASMDVYSSVIVDRMGNNAYTCTAKYRKITPVSLNASCVKLEYKSTLSGTDIQSKSTYGTPQPFPVPRDIWQIDTNTGALEFCFISSTNVVVPNLPGNCVHLTLP